MGSKKRSSTQVAEVDNHSDFHGDNDTVSNPLKKKMMNEQLKQEESAGSADGSDAGASRPIGVPSSVKDMERRKKRKAFDKERRRQALEKEQSSGPKQMVLEQNSVKVDAPVASSSTSALPEFHVNVFKDLASADASAREAAAEALVLELQEVQKAYEKLENKDVVNGGLKLEAEKDDGLDNCAASVRYAVRRLIRGVSSSRECARQGFALGLTLLVGAISSIRLDSLLKLIVDLLEVSSSMKGQEARDCLLGRLFAYGSIARSGRLNKEWDSNKDTPSIKEFTSAVISLAAKKRYLQEPSVSILLVMVDKLPAEAFLSHFLETPSLHQWFDKATEIGNPDALLLALKVREKALVDSSTFGKLLPNPFSSSKLFAAEHLSLLANSLKESTFCQPRVHGVWSVLANILLPDSVLQNEDATSISTSLKKHRKGRKSGSPEEEYGNNLQNFCEIIIENSLLVSSHDRKHLAFDVLLLLLPRLPASFLPIVLSYKIVQCLIDILSTKDSWLFKAAQYFLKGLLDWVENDDAKRVAVIVALQKHSGGKFDCITRTKTVKNLMMEFKTEAGCMLFLQNLVNMFVDDGYRSEESLNGKWGLEASSLNSDQSQTTDDNSEIGSHEEKEPVGVNANSDFLKGWVIESLPNILKYGKLDSGEKLRVQKEILKFLAVQGLFSASLGTEVTSFELQEKFKWPKTATSTALCKMCIEQLQLLLSNAQKVEGLLSLANGLELNDLGSFFMRFLGTLRNIPSVSFFRSLSGKDENALRVLQETESRLSREERNCGLSADANKLHALRYLLIQLLLQVLLWPEEFAEAASEVTMCCKKAFGITPDLLRDSAEDEMDDDAAPELMDVLVDTLLSLLPHASAPIRSAIEQVFKHFSQDVTDDGLLRMLRVIRRDLKPARHPDADDEDHDDEDDEDEEDFLAIEEDDIDGAETGETDDQTDDSEAVIGTEEEANKERPENSDDSDGGMDDEAMFRMDTYLAQIFKERRNQAGGETAQSQLVLFKLRVLSLLEIYLHENPGVPQVLMVFSHLSRALVNPNTAESSEQLAQRIWGILQKKIFKAKDVPKDESLQLSTLTPLLEKKLKLASKPFKRKKSTSNPSKKKRSASWNRHKMISSLAQNSVFWVLKIIDAKKFPETELQKVLDIIRGALSGYFDSKKSQIKVEFLEEVFRRRPWIGHRLFGFLLEKCGTTTMEFRRIEALDLVTETLRSLVPVSSDKSIQESSRKTLRHYLRKLSHLIKVLVTNMPEKQSRRSDVRKFCGRVFQMVSSVQLTKHLLKDLDPDAYAACETALGETFVNFKKAE